MTPRDSNTYRLSCMLSSDIELRELMLLSLAKAAEQNPDRRTNPVRILDDLYRFLDIFISSLPWQAVELFAGNEPLHRSLFRRIDQSIGYFYYLFDQPLEQLEGRGYVYPSLQYEPRIAQWLLQYNSMWGLFLESARSWNDEYLRLVSSDPLFGLTEGWYEAPSNWHSWNDFFARRLSSPASRPIADAAVVAPCDGDLMEWLHIDTDGKLLTAGGKGEAVKTSTLFDINTLLWGNYAGYFKGGLFTHILLDMYHYHHFHSPVDGTVVAVDSIIEYAASSGGHIIWDTEQHRYRYEQVGSLNYQLHEPRKVYLILTDEGYYVALVAVTVAQVGKIVSANELYVGCRVKRGDELGSFRCGSDVLLLLSPQAAASSCTKNSSAAGTPILMGQSLM